MPQLVEQSTAYRLLRLAESALTAIRKTSGYNTQPYVTLDFGDALEAEHARRHILHLDTSEHRVIETKPGPRWEPELELVITGISNATDGEVPRVLSLALEQDVRTAIAGSVASVRDEIAKGCVLRFGDCIHDAGALAPKKQAGFRLSITWQYPQGSTW